MAAFLFAHLTFFDHRFLLAYFTLGLLFPAATAVLPLFIKIRDLGLLDTFRGVILPSTRRRGSYHRDDQRLFDGIPRQYRPV
jgi:ABC-type glycerol-3-phosphate transport system permease component